MIYVMTRALDGLDQIDKVKTLSIPPLSAARPLSCFIAVFRYAQIFHKLGGEMMNGE